MKRGLCSPTATPEMLNPPGRPTVRPESEPSRPSRGCGASGANLAAALAVATLSATNCSPLPSACCAYMTGVMAPSQSASATTRRVAVQKALCIAECRAAQRASSVCDARQSALSTPQAPQDERDLGAIDEIFDVPHARLASTPKPGSPGANASGVPRLLRLRYRALTPAAGTPPGRRTTLT